jgi:hypothetical protein
VDRILHLSASLVHPCRQFVAAMGQNDFDGLLVYDEAGRRLYPVVSTDLGTLARASEEFGDAWEMEFVRQEYQQAAERYEQYAHISDEHGRLAAYISRSRALSKLGDLDRAIAECRRWAAFSPLAETGDSRCLLSSPTLGCSCSAGCRCSAYFNLRRDVQAAGHACNANAAGHALPGDQNFSSPARLELGRATGLLEKNADPGRHAGATHRGRGSLHPLCRAVSHSGRAAGLASRPAPAGQGCRHGLLWHGPPHGAGNLRRAGVRPEHHAGPGRLRRQLRRLECRLPHSRRGGARSRRGGGDRPEPLAAGALGASFPDWTVQLFFKDNEVFERAADEQVAVYTWTGLLFIVLILVSGAVAARSIGNQVRLNKLKNDFIATVTHELKTPLASMRVLVDTLLEGGAGAPQSHPGRNPNMVTEYLQLISKENERLSRLIDNFLTFSRMIKSRPSRCGRSVYRAQLRSRDEPARDI